MSNNNTDKLILSPDSFLNLLTTLVNYFGSAGESMIFQMGRENGRVFSKEVLSKQGEDQGSLEQRFRLIIEQASKIGWADMHVEEFNTDNGSIRVVLKDNIFKTYCIKIDLPQCYFLRGYLVGIIKELTNMDYSFEDSQCYAHGDKHCSIRMITG